MSVAIGMAHAPPSMAAPPDTAIATTAGTTMPPTAANRGVTWADVLPVAILGSIGYTVSLLIGRLALDDVAAQERTAASVLAAAVIASLVALLLLRRRSGEG